MIWRTLPLGASLLAAVALAVPATSGAADRTMASSAASPLVVGSQARAATVVSGWTTGPSAAASTVPLRVPVRVRTGDRLVARTVSLQRRALGRKSWKTIRTASTTAAGAYTAVLSAPAGTWQFRLRVKAGAGADSVRTKPHRVLVTRLMVAGGGAHTCALRPGGRVRCWGSNEYGQLGDGTRRDRVRPVTVKGLSGATAITAGGSHTCALVARGRVACWGRNAYRQLGIKGRRDRVKPVLVRGLRGATALTAGWNHTCAVIKGGRVTCWGAHDYIDEEEHSPDEVPATAPKRVSGLAGVTALAASVDFDCALGPAGRVRCWGENWQGQLGDGTRRNRSRPVRVRKLGKATAIAVGDTYGCAVVTRGRVACWGTNLYQGLGRGVGDGDTVPARSPVLVKGLKGQTAVTAGDIHTCGIGAGGRVRCLGSDLVGELGDGFGGHYLSSTVPVLARGVPRAVSVSAGSSHTCAQLPQGPVMCWGDNTSGQLGDGTRVAASASAPVGVKGLRGVTALGGGPNYTCAVGPRGTVSCWGTSGGSAGYPVEHPTPQRIAGLTGVTAVAASDGRACGLLADGTVSCWDGMRPGRPVSVPGVKGAIAISAGGYPDSLCALLTDGTVTCWNGRSAPHPLAGISGASAISLNDLGGCAVVTGGRVLCWTHATHRPTPIAGITGATAVSRHYTQLCVILEAGTVSCLNDDGEGRLAAPVRMSGVTGARVIGAGSAHTCALLRAGTLRCWGSNELGQLGDASDAFDSITPVAVSGIRNATAISFGAYHTCAALAGGSAACWGDNQEGQLGMDLGWLPRRVVGLG